MRPSGSVVRFVIGETMLIGLIVGILVSQRPKILVMGTTSLRISRIASRIPSPILEGLLKFSQETTSLDRIFDNLVQNFAGGKKMISTTAKIASLRERTGSDKGADLQENIIGQIFSRKKV